MPFGLALLIDTFWGTWEAPIGRRSCAGGALALTAWRLRRVGEQSKAHPHGRPKARFFQAAGYDESNWKTLRDEFLARRLEITIAS